MKKTELLASYPLMRGPLRALEKPLLTLHVVLERLTELSRWSGRVGMASRSRGVDGIEAEESGTGTCPGVPMDPLIELFARALRGLIGAALGAAGPGVWMGCE